MDIEIIAVPWDSGHRAVRMGAGPLRLLEAGLPERLAGAGHAVRVHTLEPQAEVTAEVATAFELAARVRECAAAALERRALPLVLAGNCVHSLGVVSSLREPRVFWFDAHGDLNTPETTLSGMLDGMALSIALGRCWTRLAAGAGLSAVTEEQVWLIGARDLDPGEHGFLARAAVHTSLDSLPEAGSSRPAHLHIDLDVLDPAIATVNQYASPNGLSPDQLHSAIARIASMHHIAGATLSAYDPAADPAGEVIPIAFALCEQIATVAAATAAD